MDFLIDAIEIVVARPEQHARCKCSVVHSFCHITPSSEIDVRLDQPYSFSDFIGSRYAAFSFRCVK
jgi:hypothetical protein